MPTIHNEISFLADIPLYKEEKPFFVLLPPDTSLDASIPRSNLQYETHKVWVKDIREMPLTPIEESGFQVLNHKSNVSFADNLDDIDLSTVEAYKKETEQLLKDNLGACYVFCYDFRVRENRKSQKEILDLGSPLIVERPAYGAHNDVTARSGPEMIQRHLSAEIQSKFFKPGYRFRIINTWRTLNPIAYDHPLAFCDFRTVHSEDLIAADRVIPGRAGEVYYLKYNKFQQWYWMEDQTPNEPAIFIMYDTKPGDQARLCPHIGFENSRAPANAPPRKSVETRSIVVSYIGGEVEL